MQYDNSNLLALALTVYEEGGPVYGPHDWVWYYQAEGYGPIPIPHHDFGVYEHRYYYIRVYPGDCNHGDWSIKLSFDGIHYRKLTDHELSLACLRNHIIQKV